MLIIEDTRNKDGKHQKKHDYWNETGVGWLRSALPFGDYCPAPTVAVDTKQDIQSGQRETEIPQGVPESAGGRMQTDLPYRG